MMDKKFFIKDLIGKNEGEIEDLFQVTSMEPKTSKDGQTYFELSISDITGTLTARIFENVDALKNNIERGKVHRLRLVFSSFTTQNGNTFSSIKVVEAQRVDEFDLRHFVPSGKVPLIVLEDELKFFIRKTNNYYIRELLEKVFLKDDEFLEKFLLAPAAKKNHHNYIGGLAEHTLRIARVAEEISKYYPMVDRDLLIAGALLHDIGKVYELEYTPEIEYTDAGKLLGHLILGYELVSNKMKESGFMGKFPEELRMKLLHMILSHHGELEFGSPVVPLLIEAQILHFLDNLDAKAEMFDEASGSRSETNPRWSRYHKTLGRSIYLGEPGGEE